MALDYFTLEEFRALPDVPEEDYDDAAVTAAAEYVQGIVEGVCQTSFVPRTVTETLDARGGTRLLLSTPYVREITSVTIDGVLSMDSFTAHHGVLERVTTGTFTPLQWGYGWRNVTVVYEAGYSDEPPADIKGAVMQATRARLLSQSSDAVMDDRRTSLNTEMGVIGFVVAGQKNPTGYPEVDAVLMRWAAKLNTVTFP